MPNSGWLELPALPVSGLTKVRDLVYFDGPLLSEFKSSSGDTYLYHWCDVDGGFNKWMIFRVSRKDLVKYLHRRISLSRLISLSQDGFVYLVDIGPDKNEKNIFLVPMASIPDDYLPDAQS